MQLYKCDRCGKIIQREERLIGHVQDNFADLCFECKEDFTKDLDAIERNYKRNIEALQIKFGMASIKQIINGKEKN